MSLIAYLFKYSYQSTNYQTLLATKQTALPLQCHRVGFEDTTMKLRLSNDTTMKLRLSNESCDSHLILHTPQDIQKVSLQ